MKNQEDLDMKGHLTIEKRDAAGGLVEVLSADNAIVLSGRDLVVKQFISERIDPISHLAVGLGTTPVSPADVSLEKELFRKAINPVDYTKDVTTTSDNRKRVVIATDLDFSEGNGALTEAGLLNAANGGIMYNRVVFLPVNKTSDFKLTLIWEITF